MPATNRRSRIAPRRNRPRREPQLHRPPAPILKQPARASQKSSYTDQTRKASPKASKRTKEVFKFPKTMRKIKSIVRLRRNRWRTKSVSSSSLRRSTSRRRSMTKSSRRNSRASLPVLMIRNNRGLKSMTTLTLSLSQWLLLLAETETCVSLSG